MLKYYILKQKASGKVINLLHTHTRAQTHTHACTRAHTYPPLLQRSPHWWLICLEGSLHFSSEHYAGANEGDIHSALSFVTDQKRDSEEENDGRRQRWGKGRKRRCVSERGKKEDACVCMSEKSGSKWHWERETGGRGMSDCVSVCLCMQVCGVLVNWRQLSNLQWDKEVCGVN